jgi:DNA-binding transcriptional LysR family regulator
MIACLRSDGLRISAPPDSRVRRPLSRSNICPAAPASHSTREEARRRMPEVPFILMCGGSPLSVADLRFRFLAKPFALGELDEALHQMQGVNGSIA